MFRFLFSTALLLMTFFTKAQNAQYFDKLGKTTPEKDAYYSRIKEGNDNYKSKYISNGNPYFEGRIIVAHEKDESLNKYAGKCKWFYRSGKLKAERSFTEAGVEEGMSAYYYESGKIWKEIEYLNGQIKDNMFTEYTEDGRPNRIFEEYFNDNSSNWDLFTTKEGGTKINNGILEIQSKVKSGTAAYLSFSSGAKNIAFEATFDMLKLANDQKTGLIFGFKDWNNYNYFLISNAGMFVGSVFEGISNSKLEETYVTSYQKGKKNNLKIIEIDDKIVFSVNGEIQYTCDRLSKYGSNVGVALFGWGAVNVDNFIYKEINFRNKNVSVSGSDVGIRATGSGLLVSENGHIITNAHVINGANSIQVEFTKDGVAKLYTAIVVQKDEDNDLAILKIDDESFKPVEKLNYAFKENGIIEVGSVAFTIGYPLALSGMGKEAKYTDGKISAKTGYNGALNSFQSTIAIQPGNSGGPVFNEKGELIGLINSGIRAADNVAYAIKLNYVKNLMEIADEKMKFPDNKNIQELSIEEKIKVLNNYVPLIKIK